MSSNNYNPHTYPYQQSSAQQYSAYQTAPATNSVAQSRQYQQPVATQGNDYMSYQRQSYGAQNNGYETAHDSSWNGSSYGEIRETTRGAAEVLHNMSNNSYTRNSATTSQSGFTPANTATAQTARYSTANSSSPQMQPQQTNATHVSYGQSQHRPHSVNANRAQQPTSRELPSPATAAAYPSQRAHNLYSQQQQQHSASPAQHKYSNSAATPANSARNATMSAAAFQQHTDHDHRQLASVDAPRTSQNSAPSVSYNYGSTPTVAPPGPIAPPSSAAETCTGQGSITVDPMAVYDPWPEYERKQEASQRQKAAEDAVRAEEERIAEVARNAEEAKKEEEERKRQEALTAASQPKQRAETTQKQRSSAEATPSAQDAEAGPGDALEAEIRAMMAKMRELNSKDPALLARIWEEERRAKAAPKSPTVQNKFPIQASAATPAPAVQANTPQAANQRRKTAPKEAPSANIAKPATPIPAPAVAVRTQAAIPNARQGGDTIWPPEKKTQLASAAAVYLNAHNPTNHIDISRVLSLLNGNPSYIELCQQLENMGMKLDRAAFARNLLTAVPDVNSSTRRMAPQPVLAQRPQVPAAVMKRDIATPAATFPANRSFPPFPHNASLAATPGAVAEMIPIRPELKRPANKEEAARKRNLSELIDLTLLDEDDIGPPPKKLHGDAMYSYGSPHPHLDEDMMAGSKRVHNFPIASVPSRANPELNPQAAPQLDREIKDRAVVEPLDKKKALRRNTYNPATIARDVLLACGKHPSERQLNQHLNVLRSNVPQIGFDSDLSTIKWDLLDPGNPPPDYFKDSVQALTEEADDEEDSEDEDREARPRAQSNAIGGESGVQARVQALPEAINPFKQKIRGRPGRHSLPDYTTPATPTRSTSSTPMSASVPRSNPASVGYSAFRAATQYGPDGKPLPKKRGRPVGWRKAIHGSAAAQAAPALDGYTDPTDKHQPSQPSSLRKVKAGGDEPIRINSRSPSVAERVPCYQSYNCKWLNCTAELHNLDTLRKHVFKVHRKETLRNMLECLWGDCGKEVTHFDPSTNMGIEKHTPYAFELESDWRGHIQQSHFDPISWDLGDGPASGLSDAHDTEAYLGDAQGRQVTPRITVDRDRLIEENASRGRGRPPKKTQEQEAHEAQQRLVSHKRRLGGPGMDRGGATLVNDKRRKGFMDSDGTEEELVDAED